MISARLPRLTDGTFDVIVPRRAHGILMVQAFAVAVMVFPSDTVIKAVGAGGYVAGLIGMFMFGAWVAATILGLHRPQPRRHPIRFVFGAVWVSALLSYVFMDRGTMTTLQLQAADRFLMQLAAVTGVALVAAECLNSLHDIRRVLRTVVWAGAFCGVVAALQFWVSLDISSYLRLLPGFTLNQVNHIIEARNALNRVAGTAIHSIELGVTAGMLLPLAIHLAIYDTDRSKKARWFPVLLIGLAIPESVSRSATIGVALTIGTLIVLMPVRQRIVALCAVPFALVVVFMSAHGLIGTLARYFSAGTSDPSIAHRVDLYPMVQQLVSHAPWLGRGGGTYLPVNAIYILDNQYLDTVIELGVIGVLAIAVYYVVPLVAALAARQRSADEELRLLCAALAGGAAAAAVCSATFDAWSFPMFLNAHALILGLIGACWRLAARGHDAAGERTTFGRRNARRERLESDLDMALSA